MYCNRIRDRIRRILSTDAIDQTQSTNLSTGSTSIHNITHRNFLRIWNTKPSKENNKNLLLYLNNSSGNTFAYVINHKHRKQKSFYKYVEQEYSRISPETEDSTIVPWFSPIIIRNSPNTDTETERIIRIEFKLESDKEATVLDYNVNDEFVTIFMYVMCGLRLPNM
jgi:hypothetical protein